MKDNEVGVIEDVCGQLNDVEGEWQKLVEECIGRLLKLIEEPKIDPVVEDMKDPELKPIPEPDPVLKEQVITPSDNLINDE